VFKCGKEITPHLPHIIELSLSYICYDPNYNYGDDEEDGDDSMDAEDDDEDDGSDDDEYSDDDDMSWKVRRAGSKCLEAVVATRHELLAEFYAKVSPALIVRFKEREENVKADIFSAFVALLKQTRPAVQSSSLDPNSMETSDSANSPVAMLQSQVPAVVKALHKQMKEKSIKTRQGCFALLTNLLAVLPNCLTEHIPALVPGIQFSLSDRNSSSNMKIDTLTFIQHLLGTPAASSSSSSALSRSRAKAQAPTVPAEVFLPVAPALVPTVLHCVDDQFYKIASEALLVLETIVRVLRPSGSSTIGKWTDYAPKIYECCLSRLRTGDIDQEVKERAISCTGRLLANMGDLLSATQLKECLPLLHDRLLNEITRLTTVRAFTSIAQSPLRLDLSPVLKGDTLLVLAGFLRKNQRALKLSTLSLLDVFVRNYGDRLQGHLRPVLAELPPLLSEADLHVAQLTLQLLTSVAKYRPEALRQMLGEGLLMGEVLRLAQSPLLQGGALTAKLEFFRALVDGPAAVGPTAGQLCDMLTTPVLSATAGTNVHKQGRATTAKCLAAVLAARGGEATPLIDNWCGLMRSGNALPHQHAFYLLAVGEVGRLQ